MLKGHKFDKYCQGSGLVSKAAMPYHPYFFTEKLKLRPYVNLDYIVLIVDGLHGM